MSLPSSFGGTLAVSTYGYAYPQHSDLLSSFGYLHFAVVPDIFIYDLADRACQLLIEQFQYGRDE